MGLTGIYLKTQDPTRKLALSLGVDSQNSGALEMSGMKHDWIILGFLKMLSLFLFSFQGGERVRWEYHNVSLARVSCLILSISPFIKLHRRNGIVDSCLLNICCLVCTLQPMKLNEHFRYKTSVLVTVSNMRKVTQSRGRTTMHLIFGVTST